jgi:hypothetical protein
LTWRRRQKRAESERISELKIFFGILRASSLRASRIQHRLSNHQSLMSYNPVKHSGFAVSLALAGAACDRLLIIDYRLLIWSPDDIVMFFGLLQKDISFPCPSYAMGKEEE